MNPTPTRKLRGVALLGAAAIAAGAIGFGATPAFAAQPGDGGTGSVTVHKLEQPDGDFGANDGSELQLPSTAVPLVAGFKVCTINGIDLSVASNWNRMKNLTATAGAAAGDAPIVTEAGTALTLSCTGAEQLTNMADGTTKFDLAADKAYVVFESTPADNAKSVAAPTIITVPLPVAGAASPAQAWNYNPHIYPKNIIVGSGATKTGDLVGDRVSFDVTVPVQPLAADEKYSEFRIDDQLSGEIAYTGGSVNLVAKNGASVALIEGTDYTLTPATNVVGTNVRLNFLAPGLAKLDANIGGKIVLTINADLKESGTTANEASITINGKTTDPGTGPEITDPENFWGGIHIMKEAKLVGGGANVPLAGATFDVYTAAAAATDCPATPDTGAVKIRGSFVSGSDGTTSKVTVAQGKYCVYETGYPAGYKPLVGGQLFTVDDSDLAATVVNVQVGVDDGDLPSLPITGAAGNVLLLGGGGLALIVAGLLFAARRRKEHAQA
ncbi:SpaH/EbpB family LPXTG-anchored major pilin [Leucobacter komagatae]|uniref:Gram-positive cocci surface proteins LPxTG domain-containing protein n=1 Tax=Leucobacter komagatae TaxID=55969 RepID=A0A0D0HVV2_9MICO|nr:SpaH/EbpB family LPXTG-anchored major pilin [Leucobacter komagatae]KIP51756.1 hypothetical protein SD72_13335 [Leucobacter komagatae]